MIELAQSCPGCFVSVPQSRYSSFLLLSSTNDNLPPWKEKLTNWAEVRLLDVASGKHRVLARAATPAALPGIGANYTLLGFTADGKKLALSTTEPGGTTKKLLLDIPDFKDQME